MYWDLHAHPSRKGCFLFGNCLPPAEAQAAKAFAKLVTLNCGYASWNDCDFSERSMNSQDPADHESKEGSGRVAMYRHTGIVCSYTIEAAYYLPRPLHGLTPLLNVETGQPVAELPARPSAPMPVYNRAYLDQLGQALAYSLLDFFSLNCTSRIPTSYYGTLDRLKDSLVNESGRISKQALPQLNKRQGRPVPAVTPMLQCRFRRKLGTADHSRPRSRAYKS